MSGYKKYPGLVTTRSGIDYPDFALGTYLRKEAELIDLMNSYCFDVLMLDTAYRYGNEQEVSNAIAKSKYPNSQVILIGKINTSQQGSGKTIRKEFMDTLHRLNVPKLDIYLIHSSRSPYYCETWGEMIQLQEEGLIETIGVSNFGIEDIEKLYQTSGVYPEINQIVIPVTNVDNELTTNQLIRYCKEKKILLQAAMPFGGEVDSCTMDTGKRQDILTKLRQHNLTCVIGTRNIQHLYQDIACIALGRSS